MTDRVVRNGSTGHIRTALHRAGAEHVCKVRSGEVTASPGAGSLAPTASAHARPSAIDYLRRASASRDLPSAHLDRATATPVRYERQRPGELLHVDVKKLCRIRSGRGWKLRGRNYETRRDRSAFPATGYDYLHVALDDHSR
jgi:hypothetical protein